MSVMTTGVHLAGVSRCIIDAGFLMDRQRVEIRPQPDCRSVTLTVDDGDDPGLRNAVVDLVDAYFLQTFLDEGGCLGTVKAQFGNGVQMPAPFGHLGGKIRDAVHDGH